MEKMTNGEILKTIDIITLYHSIREGFAPSMIMFNGELYRYDRDTEDYYAVSDYKCSLLDDIMWITSNLCDLFEDTEVEIVKNVELKDDESLLLKAMYDIIGTDKCRIMRIPHPKSSNVSGVEMCSISFSEEVEPENFKTIGSLLVPSSLFMGIKENYTYIYKAGYDGNYGVLLEDLNLVKYAQECYKGGIK